MKVISDIDNLKALNLTAIQLSDAHIQIKLDGNVMYDWVEPRLATDEDIWHSFEIDGAKYDVNYFNGEYSVDGKAHITFYGLYKDSEGTLHTHTDTWHTIDVVSLIDLVIAKIKEDIECGDLTALDELLRFVPVENLNGYLPE